ncbi:radical SAM protein [Helicobacter saguini]|uniref:Radical SAM protein n=1 Tax=Helicobacter saguini TaxID=1548018 RepID=A0A347VRS8_9HELI|nr:radical SAM protein [Helicobacter saguini]MWV62790.1 radical SAM protein [Helicobacter saguini]MWV66541.1 radical SAM protein [Helicobacter saguini]MWV68890.1 radical SAM protein [Helicobacter saguini]MWV71556.1 radical SAM protein [Helicobacter saguini]TLD93649.1 radical SAM protein [Helicobacter saguini]
MQITFGPILSRRFGVSLGVDLSPSVKQCNFNCVYCELKAAKPIDTQSEITPTQTVLDSIESALKKNNNIDVLTFTANGEPTLYPHLQELIIESKKILKPYAHIKTLILSNGTRLSECKETLQHFDIVKFSLDSIDSKKFKRVDKPSRMINLEHVKRGIIEFSRDFSGDLVCEILIVKDINDDLESNAALAEFLRNVRLKRVDISTIDRPSSHRVFPVSNARLYKIADVFSGLNVCVVTRKSDFIVAKQDLDSLQILDLLKMRPLSVMDCEILFSQSSLLVLKNLLDSKQIKQKNIVGVEFYCL